jgi:hypothetical protein
MGLRRGPIVKKKVLFYSKKKAAIKAKYYKFWLKVYHGVDDSLGYVFYKIYDVFFDRFYHYKYPYLESKGVDVNKAFLWGDFDIKPILLEDYNNVYCDILKGYHYTKIKSYDCIYWESSFGYNQEYFLRPYSDYLTSYFSVTDYFYIGIIMLLIIVGFKKIYYITFRFSQSFIFIWIFFWLILPYIYIYYLNIFFEYFSILYYYFMEDQEFLFGYILKIGYFYSVDGDDDESDSLSLDILPFYQYAAVKDFVYEREKIRRTAFRKDSFQKYLCKLKEIYFKYYKIEEHSLYPLYRKDNSRIKIDLLKRKESSEYKGSLYFDFKKSFGNILIKDTNLKPIYILNTSIDFVYFYKFKLLKGLWSKLLLLLDKKIVLLKKN